MTAGVWTEGGYGAERAMWMGSNRVWFGFVRKSNSRNENEKLQSKERGQAGDLRPGRGWEMVSREPRMDANGR